MDHRPPFLHFLQGEATFELDILPKTNNIVSQTAGRIASINAEVGQKVRKGQLLARMDDVNLAKTRMQYVNDSTELARLTELYNIGIILLKKQTKREIYCKRDNNTSR